MVVISSLHGASRMKPLSGTKCEIEAMAALKGKSELIF